MTILSIEIDTLAFQAHLPHNKLIRAITLASALLQHNCVSLKDLQRVTGFLQHCSLVIHLGRTCLQSIYTNLASFPSPYTLRRLLYNAREDLTWWKDTLHLWNGIYLFAPSRPLVALYTDASDTGLGFFFFPVSSTDHAKS